MSAVKWTKTYEVAVDTRTFRVYVSEQEGLGFHASCLWYEKERMLKAPGQPGAFQFQLEQRHAATEDAALTEIKSWIYSRFHNVGELTPARA